MGLYSKKHPLGTPSKPGSAVAVPNDPVNLQRALWVLRDLRLIEIRDSKPIDDTELDVIKNPGGISGCRCVSHHALEADQPQRRHSGTQLAARRSVDGLPSASGLVLAFFPRSVAGLALSC
jgi:ABC-type metal ion transport system substrate-binding protein